MIWSSLSSASAKRRRLPTRYVENSTAPLYSAGMGNLLLHNNLDLISGSSVELGIDFSNSGLRSGRGMKPNNP